MRSSRTSTAVCLLQVLAAVLATPLQSVSNTTLQCRSCIRAFTLSECNMVACDATTEDCYMDELVTEQLTIIYNGGCRSKQVCSPGIVGKRKRDDLVACSRCCNIQSDCNSGLCGIAIAMTPPPTSSSTSLQCRSCSSAYTLADCYEQVTCDDTLEECYIDKIVTDQLTVVYSGGCRSKQVCAIIAGGRKKRGSQVACSECCNSQSDCNNRLCGINNATIPQPTSGSTSLKCRSCNRASSLTDCYQLVTCNATLEDCYMDELITNTLSKVYNAGCRSKQVCAKSAVIGKRKRGDLVSCSRCCNSERDCNSRQCGIISGTLNTNQCYSCDHRFAASSHVTIPVDCVTMSTCPSNEMCYTLEQDIGSAHQFYYGCYRIMACKTLMQQAYDEWKLCERNITQPPPGQTWTQACGTYHTNVRALCHSCCSNPGCNYGTCREQNDRLFNLALQGKFNMSTLT